MSHGTSCPDGCVTMEEFTAVKAMVERLMSRVSDLEAENRDLKASMDETQVLLLKTHKRTMDIENTFFEKDEDGEIIDLKQPMEHKELERPVIPSKNVTEIRADYLIDYILNKTHLIPKAESVFANVKAWVVNSKEFKYFIDHELDPKYKPDTRNLRKLKKDIFETVEARFKQKQSDKQGIFVDKADHGRNELRLIYTRQLDAQEEEEMLVRMGVIRQPLQTVTT
jgi:hypothetical protein